jgi:mannose-6-phosphate isomerase-like protein (cupin superfamily)
MKKEDNIIHQKISGNFSRTIVNLDNVMVVVCDFMNGPMKEPDTLHSHTHEQITYVAEGELIFYRDGKEHHLSKGDLITIPSGIKHCVKTLSKEVRLIDSFSPIRKDFLP